MAVLKVITAPDPRLKKLSVNVDQVDDQLRKFLDDMLETMYHEKGIGLAAPQVGISKNIVVIDLKEMNDEIKDKAGHNERVVKPNEVTYPVYMINPEIIESSAEEDEFDEGCLSLPGQSVIVSRPSKIKVKYLDYNGNEQMIAPEGFLNRVIQHEMDHLKGILLIDYLTPVGKDIAIRQLEKAKRHPSQNK